VTAVLFVPATLAVNCADWPAESAAGPGKMETVTVDARASVAGHKPSEAVITIAEIEVTDMNKGFGVFRFDASPRDLPG
jgi:hypothetical protein